MDQSITQNTFAFISKLTLTKQFALTVADMICKIYYVALKHLVFHTFRVAENAQCVNDTLSIIILN